MQKSNSLTKAITTTTLITILGTSPLMAAECEIKGTNLMTAYSRAVNNGAYFSCTKVVKNKHRRGTKLKKIRGLNFVPLPTELQCSYTKFLPIPGRNRYVMTAFDFGYGTWPMNEWKISKYEMIGGGRKSPSDGIYFTAFKPQNRTWTLKLRKIWLKKAGASCSNINAVIRSAFGD